MDGGGVNVYAIDTDINFFFIFHYVRLVLPDEAEVGLAFFDEKVEGYPQKLLLLLDVVRLLQFEMLIKIRDSAEAVEEADQHDPDEGPRVRRVQLHRLQEELRGLFISPLSQQEEPHVVDRLDILSRKGKSRDNFFSSRSDLLLPGERGKLT